MNTTEETFNIYLFLDELIEEMGMNRETPEKLVSLKEAMVQALSRQIFEAAAENIEPEVIEAVMEELKDETDPGFILQELLQTSPSAQAAMLLTIDTFKNNTLEAFNTLKIR